MYSLFDSSFPIAGHSEGMNVARLASGVQSLWETNHGAAGKDAGFRLVQAGFHFRTALMGIRRAEAVGTPSGDRLKQVLDESEDQLLAFSGAKETVTSFASTLDLAAAAVFRLYYGPMDPAHPGREHDLWNFPTDAKLPTPLASNERDWLNRTKSAGEMKMLTEVRDLFTHRYFPRHLTIGAFKHEFDLDGKRVAFGDLVKEMREFTIDRLVALSLMYESP
jgi:hypothetical protein